MTSQSEDHDTADDDDTPATISEYHAEQQYMVLLGDIYDTVEICGYTFDAGRALKELDPIAFREGMLAYFDGEGVEID